VAIHGVHDRGKIFVVEVNWEASVDVDHLRRRTWAHPSLARTMCSIRSSSFCRSTTSTYVSSGNEDLKHTQPSKP